jgi:carbon starvation protein
MFEALFILTTIDAGTRVGRFLLQDLLGNIWKPLANTHSWGANIFSSGLLVAAWGCFLYQGVIDPNGGINSLWPIFGIANQLLAVIAFCLGTTLLLKMGKRRHVWITLAPLAFLIAVTFSAGWMKIFAPDPRLGFLAGADALAQKAAAGKMDAHLASTLIFNARLDAAVTGAFLLGVLVIVAGSAHSWLQLVRGTKSVALNESPFVELEAI